MTNDDVILLDLGKRLLNSGREWTDENGVKLRPYYASASLHSASLSIGSEETRLQISLPYGLRLTEEEERAVRALWTQPNVKPVVEENP